MIGESDTQVGGLLASHLAMSVFAHRVVSPRSERRNLCAANVYQATRSDSIYQHADCPSDGARTFSARCVADGEAAWSSRPDAGARFVLRFTDCAMMEDYR